MKQVYTNIVPSTGVHVAGICKIQIAVKEWLMNEIEIDFATGKVINPVSLIAGKSWLTIDLVEPSYEFEEKPKTNKSGSYYDIVAGGTTNDLDSTILQSLESLRYHEFVAIVRDRKKRSRIVGNKEAGMILQISNGQKNTQGGKLEVGIELSMQSEFASPFYEPGTVS